MPCVQSCAFLWLIFDKHLLLYKYLKNCFVILTSVLYSYHRKILLHRRAWKKELSIPAFFRLSFGPEMFYRLSFPPRRFMWTSVLKLYQALHTQAHDSFQSLAWLHRVWQIGSNSKNGNWSERSELTLWKLHFKSYERSEHRLVFFQMPFESNSFVSEASYFELAQAQFWITLCSFFLATSVVGNTLPSLQVCKSRDKRSVSKLLCPK